MDAAARRAAILSVLERTDHPVSAAALAREFSVSRQIIVGDVDLLRAGGLSIAATPRGYMLPEEHSGLVRTLACRHRADQMEDELNAIVDQGCTVIDVIVEHPIYGQLTGPLQLSSRYDPVCGPLPPVRRPPPVQPHRGHPPAHHLLPRRDRLPAGPDRPGTVRCSAGGMIHTNSHLALYQKRSPLPDRRRGAFSKR